MKHIKLENCTLAFKVFKKGVTKGWIKILNPNNGTFNIDDKKVFYLNLGYKVK